MDHICSSPILDNAARQIHSYNQSYLEIYFILSLHTTVFFKNEVDSRFFHHTKEDTICDSNQYQG
jgi:hypothetical protein